MSVEHVERLRVAWIDTDAGGRIHFSNAFRWAELAETALMRGAVSLDEWGDFPRRHVEAEFLKVLTFDDEIDVRIEVERLGRTSITYAWTISKRRRGMHRRPPHRRPRRQGRSSRAAARPRARSAVSLVLSLVVPARVVVLAHRREDVEHERAVRPAIRGVLDAAR